MNSISSKSSAVRVDQQGPVLIITIDRPEVRNAVNGPTAKALVDVFTQFEHDESALVAVLTGADGNFCAGADLKAVSAGEFGHVLELTSLDDNLDANGPMGPTYMRLSKPVIAAVSGFAVAGGLELAAWCDMRVAEEDATFGVYCRRWGVPLIDGGTVRLPRLIGQSNALDMIITGRSVGADEAKIMGLANRVVAKGQGLAEAIKLAQMVAQFPQLCMNGDRMSAREQWDLSFEDAMVNESRHGHVASRAGESVSGATRFKDGKGRSGSFEDI